MSKLFIKIAVSVVVVIVILASVLMFIFIPRGTADPTPNLWNNGEAFDIADIVEVQKEQGEDFKILVLADIQFDVLHQSKKVIKEELKIMVDNLAPDLIVTVGDNFAGVFNHFGVSAFVEMLDELNVPWATIYGNHERDFGSDLYYIAEQIQKSEHGIFITGPTDIDGVGNYVINVMEEDKIISSLYMMDSNEEVAVEDDNGDVSKYYDNMRDSQVAWYEDNVNGIKKVAGKNVPSILFSHVAQPEFKEATDLYDAGDSAVTYNYGEINEGVCNSKYGYGMFDKMIELGSTKYNFIGHDHTNNLSLTYKGITMSYVNKTGDFSSYSEGNTGGTFITIDGNGNVDHELIFSSKLLLNL